MYEISMHSFNILNESPPLLKSFVLQSWTNGVRAVGVFSKVSCCLEFSKWLQQDALEARPWLLSFKAMGQITTVLRLLRGFWKGEQWRSTRSRERLTSRKKKANQTMELSSCSNYNSRSPLGGNKNLPAGEEARRVTPGYKQLRVAWRNHLFFSVGYALKPTGKGETLFRMCWATSQEFLYSRGDIE